jgi:hypothetical protein
VRRWLQGWRGRLVVLIGLALLAVGAFVARPREDRITLKNFDSIRGGMSRREIAAILGAPGDCRTRPTGCRGSSIFDHVRDFDEADATTDGDIWDSDAGSIHVDYGSAGTVVYVAYQETEQLDQSPLGNLLWRIRRQWQHWFPE